MNGLFITPHALKQLRKRWPEVRCLSDRRIIRTVKPRIQKALDAKKRVQTPGGTYVPVSLEGRDGYAVLQELQVVTFLLYEMCEEVNQIGDFF